MKKLLMHARIMVPLLSVAALLVAPAYAGVDSKSANGAITTHFTAEYFNGQGGFFTGAGERIVKTGPKAFTKDSETLLISDISTWPAGTYVIVVDIPEDSETGFATWFSDFDGSVAVSGTIVVTDNGDGTGTMKVEAYY